MRRIPPEQRREALIDAAIKVIARGGVAAATTRAVVAEAGMPLGAYHYAFASQDDLMRAVIDTVTEHERFVAEASSLDASSIGAAVTSGLQAYIDLLVADPERELALFELALFARRKSASGQMGEQWAVYHRAGEALLEYAAQVTESEWMLPVSDLARLLIATVDGITLAWLADHDTLAARRNAQVIADSIAAYARPRAVFNEQESAHAD